MNAEGICPICKIELSEKEIEGEKNHSYTLKFCGKCRREYYNVKSDEVERIEYSDIETVSDNEGESPVLLCDDSDLRGFPKEYLKKKNKDNESYLSEYFPGATIETREYVPT